MGEIIKDLPEGCEVVIGTDNDREGDKLAVEIKELCPDGAEIHREVPAEGKDWNEQVQLEREPEPELGRGDYEMEM